MGQEELATTSTGKSPTREKGDQTNTPVNSTEVLPQKLRAACKRAAHPPGLAPRRPPPPMRYDQARFQSPRWLRAPAPAQAQDDRLNNRRRRGGLDEVGGSSSSGGSSNRRGHGRDFDDDDNDSNLNNTHCQRQPAGDSWQQP